MSARFTKLRAMRLPSREMLQSRLLQLRKVYWPAIKAALWESAVAIAKLLAIAFFAITLYQGFTGGFELDAIAWVYIALMVGVTVLLAIDFWQAPHRASWQAYDVLAGAAPAPRQSAADYDARFRTLPTIGDPRVGARISMHGHPVMVIGPSADRPSCYVVVCLSGDMAGHRWLADKGWITRKCRRAGLLPQ